MKEANRIKLFGLSTHLAERDLDKIEKDFDLDLGRSSVSSDYKDLQYYPQFDERIRREAATMAAHYELFFSLEKSIRSLIAETLRDNHGSSWWDVADVIPSSVKTEVQSNMRREIDQAVAPRSTEEIDYTTFGQLGDIVRHRWEDFDDIFNSQKAFTKVMGSLNVLRGPIAHCSPLPESEVIRLRTTLEDWFRLMS